MALNIHERMLAEAISSMLQQDAKLGLSIHDESDFDSAERGYEYLHGQIDEMFALKAAELTHAEGVNQAFKKVHNYKYLDDPSFKTAMEKEMVAQAIPGKDREQAVKFVEEVLKDIKEEQKVWSEKDFGFHPELDEIKEICQPDQDLEFSIEEVDGWPMESNIEWEPGDASPGRTPSDS